MDNEAASDQGETQRSWRMADQYFLEGDVEIGTKPWNDSFVMTIKVNDQTRRVFFDPAGRITHIRPI